MQSPVYCVCTSQGLDMFFVFFYFIFPHPQSASKREKKTAKSLDDTPESDQEVGSDRREMPPPFWKHMTGVCVSSFFSQSRRQQTQAATLWRLCCPVTDGTQQAVFHIALRF